LGESPTQPCIASYAELRKFLYLMVKEAGEMVSHQIPLACFWNGCTQQDFQKTSFNIPPQWRPNYFPQWGKQK
jgi:hypothetical protein